MAGVVRAIGWHGNRLRPGCAGIGTVNYREAVEPLLHTSNLDFLAAVAGTDFAPRYYKLCRRNPLRLDVPACKAPAADVLRAARAAGPANKLPGPGRPFGFELPGGMAASELTFVLQNRTTIETHFVVPFRGGLEKSTFAILALDVTRIRGEQPPAPPYPRPEFHTLEELAAILAEVYALGCMLIGIGDGQDR